MKKEKWRWLFPVLIACNFSLFSIPLTRSSMGPSQPYFAHNTRTDLISINIVWIATGASALVGSMLSGIIFKRIVSHVLLVFGFLQMITGFTSMALPFVYSFELLAFIIGVRDLAKSLILTMASAVPVYFLGKKNSEVQVQIAGVSNGIGLFIGPTIIGSFLPLKDIKVCRNADIVTYEKDKEIMEILLPPYMTISFINFAVGILFLSLIFLPYDVPKGENYEDQWIEDKIVKSEQKSLFITTIESILTFLVGATHAAPMALMMGLIFTYGLCGPLQMTAKEAIIADYCFHLGIMLGRIFATIIVQFLKQKQSILISILCCNTIIFAIILSFVSSTSKSGFLIGIIGYSTFGAGIFPCLYSWISQNTDITGLKGSIFQSGVWFGFSIGPILGGFAGGNTYSMNIWYINLMFTVGNMIIFISLGQFYRLVNKN